MHFQPLRLKYLNNYWMDWQEFYIDFHDPLGRNPNHYDDPLTCP